MEGGETMDFRGYVLCIEALIFFLWYVGWMSK